jgi:hypothetical protein
MPNPSRLRKTFGFVSGYRFSDTASLSKSIAPLGGWGVHMEFFGGLRVAESGGISWKLGDGTIVPFPALVCYWVEGWGSVFYNYYNGELLF